MHLRRSRTLPLLVVLLATGCESLQNRVIGHVAVARFEGLHADLPDDGSLHVVLCGTAGTPDDPERANACTAILGAGRFLLVDAGPRSWKTIEDARLPAERLDGVLLTHLHSDHVGGLGRAIEASWIAGRIRPLPVYGPPGVEAVVEGFGGVLAASDRYRIALHGEDLLPPGGAGAVARTVTVSGREGATVLAAGDLVVTAFRVDHEPAEPAYGYRFDYRGRSVVVSGDTRFSPNLVRHARGADLLVHEAAAPHLVDPAIEALRDTRFRRWAELAGDVLTVHSTPREAAEAARDAGVRMLVLTHVIPPLPNAIAEWSFAKDVDDEWRGETRIGEDGMRFTLAPGSAAIEVD